MKDEISKRFDKEAKEYCKLLQQDKRIRIDSLIKGAIMFRFKAFLNSELERQGEEWCDLIDGELARNQDYYYSLMREQEKRLRLNVDEVKNCIWIHTTAVIEDGVPKVEGSGLAATAICALKDKEK